MSSMLKKIDWEVIKQLEAEHYVTIRKHPVADLFICNYTAKTQYDSYWNDYTLSCRGLIIDNEGAIVARPFRKFFNLHGEVKLSDLPDEDYQVYDKLDGSLGILYWLDELPYIATRGTFDAPQASRATQILHDKYASLIPTLDRDTTYLFEIIFPENRIVIDYQDTEDIFLLAQIHTPSGRDIGVADIGFPLVKPYPDITSLEDLEKLAQEGKEGFVVRFSDGQRVKLKFPEYVRLHRIITGLSTITIWEYLSQGQSLEALLEKIPDEVFDWVRTTSASILSDYRSIEQQCREVYQELPTRKETALYFQQQQYPSVLFAMLTGKNYAPIIWKMIRPKGGETFFRSQLDTSN